MSDERDRLRRREATEPSLYDMVDLVARRLVTAIVLAGGLVAFGLWTQDSAEAPGYQIAAGADGRIYRVNTDSGSIVACEGDTCALIQRASEDLADELPERIKAALPPPAQTPATNEAAAAPAEQGKR